MVNENVQGVIPLAGKGHTHRNRENYQSGEFRNLLNCEISPEGSLVSRRPVFGITDEEGVVTGGMQKILGHYKDSIVTWGYEPVTETHKAWSTGGEMSSLGENLWNTNSIIVDLAIVGSVWAAPVGFFRYNKINYWIVCAYDNGDVTYYLYRAPDPAGGDITDIVFADLTRSTIFTESLSEKRPSFPWMKSFFIHKERLWLVTQNQAYFSKATDPTVWSVPDGGFFNFLEDNVQDACALNDSVYILSDNSVSIITYTADPNTDANVRKISDSLGGDSCAIVGDTVYFVRDDAIYSITNSNVSKEIELNARFVYNSLGRWRLTAFGEYLIAHYTRIARIGSYGTSYPEDYNDPDEWLNLFYNMWASYGQVSAKDLDLAEDVDVDTLFINTEVGSVSAFDLGTEFRVGEFYFVPVENNSNDQYLYMLMHHSTDAEDCNSCINVMKYQPLDTDTAVDYLIGYNGSDYVAQAQSYELVIEIDSYVPDGSEFLTKKFRNLLLEGMFPQNMKFFAAYNNSAYAEIAEIGSNNALGDARFPVPIRVGLNQRAKSINILLYCTSESEDFVSNFLLTRLVTLWSYTGRAPVAGAYVSGSLA